MLINSSKIRRPQSAFTPRRSSGGFLNTDNFKKASQFPNEKGPNLEMKDPYDVVEVKKNSILVKVSGEPTLLVELKRFVTNELKKLNAENSPAGDPTRVSVYRHAFQSFIEEFKSYRAFLSEIKHEYEQHIDTLISKLESIYSQLALFKFEAAEQQKKIVMDLVSHSEELKQDRDLMIKEMKKWESEALQVKQRLSGIDDEIKNKNARLKEEEVYITQLLETESKHNMIISTLEDNISVQTEAIQELKRENALLSESLKASYEKIEEIKKQYKDTVPRYEHELLSAEYISYKSRFEQQQDLTMKMHQQILEAQKKHEQFIRDLEKRFVERLKYAAPDWDFISKRCAGNLDAIWGPCNGMNCNETIVTLIQMLSRGSTLSHDTTNANLNRSINSTGMEAITEAKGDRSLTNLKLLEQKDEKQTYFLGLGVSATIPRYLRCKGRIRNRCLPRKSCALLIKDIWSEKLKFDTSKKLIAKPCSLSQYLYLYLSKRFTTQELISEWGYNLTEACKIHRTNLTDCWVFLDILEDKLDEAVFYHLAKVLEDFKVTFTKIDASLNDGIASGIITKTDLFPKLKEIWKYKTQKQLHELQTALDADQPGAKVTYRWLFQNEVDSAFLEAIKMQEMEDRAKYLKDLEAAILNYHGAVMTALTSVEFSRILGRFDVDKKKSDVDAYVARGFGTVVEKLKPRDTMTIGKFLANISKGVLFRG